MSAIAQRRNDWKIAMEAEGHEPILDEDGNLDEGVADYDWHHGPGCRRCGWSCCWHCETIDDIPPCNDELAEREAHNFAFARGQAEREEAIRSQERKACLSRALRAGPMIPDAVVRAIMATGDKRGETR